MLQGGSGYVWAVVCGSGCVCVGGSGDHDVGAVSVLQSRASVTSHIIFILQDFLMEKSKHRIQYSYLQTYAPYSDDSKVVKKVDPKVS